MLKCPGLAFYKKKFFFKFLPGFQLWQPSTPPRRARWAQIRRSEWTGQILGRPGRTKGETRGTTVPARSSWARRSAGQLCPAGCAAAAGWADTRVRAFPPVGGAVRGTCAAARSGSGRGAGRGGAAAAAAARGHRAPWGGWRRLRGGRRGVSTGQSAAQSGGARGSSQPAAAVPWVSGGVVWPAVECLGGRRSPVCVRACPCVSVCARTRAPDV